MRAVSRFGRPLLAAGLMLAPAMALAQQQPPPATTAPADSVGPRVLQNFSLGGTVTRPADGPVAQPSPPPRAEAQSAPKATAPRTAAAPAPAARHSQTAAAEPPPIAQAAPPPRPESSLPAAAGLAPPATVPAAGMVAPTPATAPSFPADPRPPGPLSSVHDYPMLAWLLEALVLALAGAFLFWRTRGRELFAGSARFDLFTGAEPEPAAAPPPAPAPRATPGPSPQPAPAPPPAVPKPAAPAAAGVVSTSLRPWIDIGFQPVRCVLDDQRVMVEFDLELFNSGSAPARAVLVEARLFNAGADQDAQIGAFFASPAGPGERIAILSPLKRLAARTQAVAPREQIHAYEMGGRPVFVPLIAFNVRYSWSGGEGQTSVSHLLGRDTKSDKLGPFHLDLGPHIFRNLAARLLPTGIRR